MNNERLSFANDDKPIRVSRASLDALRFRDPLSDDVLADEVDDSIEYLIEEIINPIKAKRRGRKPKLLVADGELLRR